MSVLWRRLQDRLSARDFASSRLLVALDFDGTLSDIVPRPEAAALGAGTRRLLARRPDTKVAIISGRGLEDVRGRVGLPGLYYAGNHGLEIHGPGIRWEHPSAGEVRASLRSAFAQDLREFPGLELENKRLGFALHYRAVPEARHRTLRERMSLRLLEFGKRYRILHGHKVFDFRLDVRWDKGHALRAIRRSLPGGWSSVFVGDDVSDEEAFATIGPQALTVRVGRVRKTAAQFVLPRRHLVDALLDRLCRRPGAGAPPDGRPR